jgi:riboflavin synthase
MFTGLIEGIGKIKSLRRSREDMIITVLAPFDLTECQVGDSIAVDGVCLTVTEVSGDVFRVDVSAETVSRTTLRFITPGDEINLERALRLSDRLGGHLVSGHVDGTGRILQKEHRDRSWFVKTGIDEQMSRYIVEKGSIAVDGISLTVNRCNKDSFEVNIIPQTGKETTLLAKNAGGIVNIETDIIGKYVESLLGGILPPGERAGSEIDLDFLNKHGFGN